LGQGKFIKGRTLGKLLSNNSFDLLYDMLVLPIHCPLASTACPGTNVIKHFTPIIYEKSI